MSEHNGKYIPDLEVGDFVKAEGRVFRLTEVHIVHDGPSKAILVDADTELH